MSKQSMIHFDLEFSGLLLPVIADEKGNKAVPIKPVCEVIGLDWSWQHKKLTDTYLSKRLGTCIGEVYYAGQRREMVCIRLDRVAAFLNTVNPENVRGQGNEPAADFLERKQEEWDDLIDTYEREYGILKVKRAGAAKQPGVRDLLAILRDMEKMKSPSKLALLTSLARKISNDLGVDYDGTAAADEAAIK